MNALLSVLRDILLLVGVELIQRASVVLVEKATTSSTPENPTPDTEMVDVQALLFDRDNPFRTWVESIIFKVVTMRANLANTTSAIVFSLSGVMVPATLVELIIRLVDDHSITVVTNIENKKEVTYDYLAAKELSEFACNIFELFLRNATGSYEKQGLQAGIPELVANFIGEVLRSRGIRPFNYSVSIYDSSKHVVYSETNQVDIFRNELVYGKYAVIKYKDTKANVFTYAIVLPKKGKFDSSFSLDNFDYEKLTVFVGQVFQLENTDLDVTAIPFNALPKVLPIIYKNL